MISCFTGFHKHDCVSGAFISLNYSRSLACELFLVPVRDVAQMLVDHENNHNHNKNPSGASVDRKCFYCEAFADTLFNVHIDHILPQLMTGLIGFYGF